MTLHQFLSILRGRWRLAVTVFAGVVIVFLAATILTPKGYTATASVVVNAEPDPAAATAGGSVSAQYLANYIATQVDIISSERVSENVVRDLKLDKITNFRNEWASAGGHGDLVSWIAVERIGRALAVTPSRESNVIDIAVTWADPVFASVLANGFARAYFETNVDLKVQSAKQFADWFDVQSLALRQDLEVKQKRLSDYENSEGIVATDQKLDVESARLAELNRQLVAIEALRQESQSRQQQVGVNAADLPEVLQSPLISALKTELTLAQAKLQDIGVRLGKQHPDYKVTDARIKSLQSAISQESSRIVASLRVTTEVDQRREADIRAALAVEKALMLQRNAKNDQLSILQSDVVTAQRNLDDVTQRLAQSRLESHVKQTNVVMLTNAIPPSRPTSPKRLVNVVLGILVGILAAVGTVIRVEWIDRRIRDDAEILQLLNGIPLLGRIDAVGIQDTEEHLIDAGQPRLVSPAM